MATGEYQALAAVVVSLRAVSGVVLYGGFDAIPYV